MEIFVNCHIKNQIKKNKKVIVQKVILDQIYYKKLYLEETMLKKYSRSTQKLMLLIFE